MRSARQEKAIAVELADKHVPKKRSLGRPSRSNEELLDFALDLFLENGYEQTSLDAITSAAGMAKRTVYARYSDKATLFKAALKRAIDEWIVPIERLKAAETEDLEETLLRIGRILIENIMKPDGLRLLRLTNAIANRMPEIATDNALRGTAPTEAFLADLFARRLETRNEAVLNSADAGKTFLYLMTGGPSSRAVWGMHFDQEALDQHVRNSVKLFLYGMLPRGVTSPEMERENQSLRKLLTDALLDKMAMAEKLSR